MSNVSFVDIGNTNIKVFENETKKIYTYDQKIEIQNKKVLISCVNKEGLKNIKLLDKNVSIINKEDYHLLEVNKLDITELGSDRFVNNIGAIDKFGSNLIIFNLGTALTVDIIVENKLISGYIIPSINLIKKSLFMETENLFDFNLQKKSKHGIDTISQINDGIGYMIIGFINEIIKKYNKNKQTVIISGGGVYHLGQIFDFDELQTAINKKVIIENYHEYDNCMYNGFKLLNSYKGD